MRIILTHFSSYKPIFFLLYVQLNVKYVYICKKNNFIEKKAQYMATFHGIFL